MQRTNSRRPISQQAAIAVMEEERWDLEDVAFPSVLRAKDNTDKSNTADTLLS
jgi:hypothetical protein